LARPERRLAMSGQVIRFFPRQTFVSDGAANTECYSDPFDVSQFTEMTVDFRLLGIVGTTTSVIPLLETAEDLHVPDGHWFSALTFTTRTAVGGQNKTATGLSRFARMRLTIANISTFDGVINVEVIGVGRTG
jgi:hypothetical protein